MAKDKGSNPIEVNTQGIVKNSELGSLQALLNEKASNEYVNTQLATKQDKFIGYSGNFTFISSIEFAGESVTTKTVTVANGIITGIV